MCSFHAVAFRSRRDVWQGALEFKQLGGQWWGDPGFCFGPWVLEQAAGHRTGAEDGRWTTQLVDDIEATREGGMRII